MSEETIVFALVYTARAHLKRITPSHHTLSTIYHTVLWFARAQHSSSKTALLWFPRAMFRRSSCGSSPSLSMTSSLPSPSLIHSYPTFKLLWVPRAMFRRPSCGSSPLSMTSSFPSPSPIHSYSTFKLLWVPRAMCSHIKSPTIL